MESKYSNPSAKESPPTYYQVAGDDEEVDVTGDDLYNCPYCSMQFSSKSSLLEHQNKHHLNKKPFKCELCGKTFAVRRYLREHERRHRLKLAAQKMAPLAEDKLKCSHCHSEFNTPQDLSLHMRLHAEKEVGEYRLHDWIQRGMALPSSCTSCFLIGGFQSSSTNPLDAIRRLKPT
ncbi:uncharacterized protein AKAME5_001511700 [Lates japonicus]|uniref:C2H2-type domain-containing protein n=1 Tax=Lates japonicus TaxID=270547 RepID=A0AAD3N1T0_LATJO|nr:uncharacterized protein AKAME5_001511700 [Lates japonicus]